LAEAAEAPEKTQESAPSAELPYLYQRLLAALTSPLINLFPPEKTRKDLTLGNFFTYGWKQGWAEPEEGPQDAPRFRLMRIRRAFWERELRATYNFTFRANKYLGAEFPWQATAPVLLTPFSNTPSLRSSR